MSHNKSSKKDATVKNICDMNDKSCKYKFFPALVEAYMKKGEGKRAFMERIGIGAQGSMFKGFNDGDRHVTDNVFKRIRATLGWKAEETMKWEMLLKKDHQTLAQSLKGKNSKKKAQQPVVSHVENVATLQNAPPSPENHHSCRPDVRVLIQDFKSLTEHRHKLDDAVFQRFLEIAYHIADNKIEMFGGRYNLEWDWFKAILEQGMMNFYETDEALDLFLLETLHFDDGIIRFIKEGRVLRPLRLLISEYRAAIWDPIGAKVNVSKESGSSSY